MKVCDLTQFYSPASGGVRRYIGEKAAWMRTHTERDEHVLIVPGECDGCTGDARARSYTIASPLVSRTSRYRVLLRGEAVERILEKERPDVIECGDPYQVAWGSIRSGAALGIPVVGFYHSHFPEAYVRPALRWLGEAATEFFVDLSRHYVRALYPRFARTLVPSPALEAMLREWGVENTTHTDLGIDPAVFHPRPAPGEDVRAEHGIAPARPLLLYVGRLAQEKNTHTLFAAAHRLAARMDFHLLVVGDGLQRRELRALMTDHRSLITHLPRAETAQLARLYRAADLLVHPGVQETFGLTALEAQACGTPVLGIRGSYLDRIILHTQEHWAVEDSPAALAAAIAAALRGELKRDPAALHARIAGQFAWDRVFARLFDVYREVIHTYRPR